MKKIVFTLLTFFFTCSLSSAYGTEIQLPKPAPHQIKWHEAFRLIVEYIRLHEKIRFRYRSGNRFRNTPVMEHRHELRFRFRTRC